MASLCVLLAVGLLVQLHISAGFRGGLGPDVTRFFSLEASSTCGDTPPSGSGDGLGIVSCLPGERNVSFVLDGDLESWWQSEDGESPVELTFSLQNPSLFLELSSLRLSFRDSLPLSLSVEVRPLSSQEFTSLKQYTSDGSCDLTTPCTNISSIVIESSANLTTLLVPLYETVDAVRLVIEGFQPDLPFESQHYSLSAAVISANIASGYFVRSLHYTQALGSDGMITPTGERVPIGTDQTVFPGSQGYAMLEFSDEELAMVQFVFPSIPKAGRYRLVFRYNQLGVSRRPTVLILQGGMAVTARVSLHTNCEAPCYSTVVESANINQDAIFDLVEGQLTVIISLEAINVLIDSLIAIPEEFFAAEIPGGEQFSQECDVTTGIVSSLLCLQGATQLSLDRYGETYSCECGGVGTNRNVSCDSYGGQCSCSEPAEGLDSYIGRQCDLCPFYSYQTPDGCTECECPDLLDMCDVMTGQCSSCPPLVIGRSCDSCIDNSFGDPIVGCEPCQCDLIGSVSSCDQTNGSCNCKTGVAGLTCDRCDEGYYSFSAVGCEACGCDGVGSVGVVCDLSGQCTCKPGVSGVKCSQCLPGYFAFSDNGCALCNCSGRSSNCTLHPDASLSSPREVCSCPHPYAGDSCEECVGGFFLSELSGECEACECNGRAELCAAGTGVCLDCEANTTGSSCEQCLEGFYDNEPGPDRNCVDCPCDSITVLNSSCVVSSSGEPSCHCLSGHIGSLCDTCEDGYYGDPPSFRCTSCDCNGNIDPDTPMSCDHDTGVCLLCINNSTGDECQFCDVGFFGDSTIQNCQSCSCLEAGSDSSLCNATTGQCSCLEGVGGQSCDQCQDGFWNFTAGSGCEPCACGEGSTSEVCDVVTGACPCRPGVGGDECFICLAGFYNFTAQGCKDCSCGVGSVNASCLSEGRCYCQPGVIGTKCDECAPFHTDLSSNGCEPCGECEQSLREDLQTAVQEVQLAEGDLDTFEALYRADIEGWSVINASVEVLSEGIASNTQRLDNLEDRFDDLEAVSEEVDEREEGILAEISTSLEEVTNLLPYAESVSAHIQNVYNTMQDVLIDIGLVNSMLRSSLVIIEQKAITAEMISNDIINLTATPHRDDYSTEVIRTTALLTQAQRIVGQFAIYLEYGRNQLSQTTNISRKYERIGEHSNELTNQIVSLQNNLSAAKDSVNAIAANLQQITSDVATVNYVIAFANTTLQNADSLLNDLQISLMVIRNYIEELGEIIGEEVTNNDFSGSGSGFGSGFMSGAGSENGQVEPSIPSDAEPSTVRMAVALLGERVGSLTREVDECAEVLRLAEDHVTSLQRTAQEINNTLSPSLSAGNSAVSAIIDYMDTIALIQQAANITTTTTATLEQVRATLSDLDNQTFEEEAANQLVTAEAQLAETQSLVETVLNLTQAFESATNLVKIDTNETSRVALDVIALRQRVNDLSTAAMFLNVNNTSSLSRNIAEVEAMQARLIERVPPLLADIAVSTALVEEAQMLASQTNELITSTNASILNTSEHVRASTDLLTAAQAQADNNSQLLVSISSTVDSINRQLAIAMEAAASIDIALSFNGNMRRTYPAPPTTNTTTTTISLAFRPAQVEYGTLFYTSSGTELSNMEIRPDQGFSLRLFNGSVQFGYDGVSVVSTEEGAVRVDQWYQLYASRDLDSVYLSVAPLQGGVPTYSVSTATTSLAMPTAADIIVLGGGVEDMGLVVPNNDGYLGCIDRVIVNNEQLALLLPNERSPIVTVCGPRPPADLPRAFETGVWLQGAGSFLALNPAPLSIEGGVSVSLSFRTLTPSGTILYLTSSDLVAYVIVYVDNGWVWLDYSQTGLDRIRIRSTSTYADGQWYALSVRLNQQGVVLTVNSTDVVQGGSPTIMPGAFNSTNYLFIGGVSPRVEEVVETLKPSLPGCVRDISIDDQLLDLQQNTDSYRVSLGGCPEQVSSGVRFMGEGYGQFSVAQRVEGVAIEFRTSQLAALLLQVNSQPPLSLSLYHTRVRLDFGSYTIMSATSGLNDNRWHTVVIANSTLTVDDEVYSIDPLVSGGTPTGLLVGGSPDQTSAVVGESLRGCVRNLQYNGGLLDFNNAESLVGVSLYGCHSPSLTIPTPPPPPPLSPPPSTRPNVTVGLGGAPGSFIAVRLSHEELLIAHSIVLEFRTSSSDALLLYTQDVVAVFADYLSLELRGGRLYYSYNLGSGRVFITSNHTYNDGLLHIVEIRRAAQMGELIVDGGLEVVSDTAPGSFTQLNIYSGLLYLGGVPSILELALTWPGQEEPLSALACFHALSINGAYQDLGAPHAVNGGTGCLESYNNVATFNTDSYLQLLDNFDGGISFSFSLGFRTSSCSGLLLYAHSLLFPDHVALELLNGTVRFVFDNGPMETVVEYTPPSPAHLCDNEWHTLRAEKDGVRGVLSVDEGDPVSALSPHPSFRAVNINDPLYVGGVAATVRRRFTSQAPSFQGCIADLYLSQGEEGPRRLLLAQAVDGANVDHNICSL